MRAAAFALCATLALTLAGPASAQELQTITYRAKKGDTLDLLAAEFYGSREHAIFIMKVNGITHKRPLKRHERLKIPISVEVTAGVNDTLESLAEHYLGDARRAKYLAEFNNLPHDATIGAGQTLTIPFHVTHTAERKVSLREIAAAYFRDKKKAELLKNYNFLDKNTLDKGESIVIPIYHVRVSASKLPPRDDKSAALMEKRRKEMEQASRALPEARLAWQRGDYAGVKRILTQIDLDFLDTELAVGVGVLLGSAYIAFDDPETALATFERVLERDPDHKLAAYSYSPKILEVWKRAGGQVDHTARN